MGLSQMNLRQLFCFLKTRSANGLYWERIRNMHIRKYPLAFFFIASACLYAPCGITQILHVGVNQPYPTLEAAAARAVPGDTILFHAGVYKGGESIARLQGKPGKPITLVGVAKDTVIIRGGTAGWMLRNVAWLHIQRLTFEQQTANGFNVDDGGLFDSPSHHIVFTRCTFRNIQASGNNDLLKLSGLDSFEIRDCTFLNGAKGGSGIDMVGCHNGLITGCRFQNMGSNAVQAKGGSRFIRIERNYFNNCGERTLNLGGSTGLPFFRPQNANYEAADLQVYSNLIIGSVSAINYVGCTRVDVINNTIYRPGKWVLRILQENRDTSRFIRCSNNSFRNNIICRGNQVTYDCNIGGATNPGSFRFSHNLWYHDENPGWRGPVGLPVTDSNSIVGSNPLFTNPAAHDLSIPAHSPAAGKGLAVLQPVYDFGGRLFAPRRSIGCYEVK
jgi:hypothetical protein